jgi:hypothetical protein
MGNSAHILGVEFYEYYTVPSVFIQEKLRMCDIPFTGSSHSTVRI